jgi:hypothetical protein
VTDPSPAPRGHHPTAGDAAGGTAPAAQPAPGPAAVVLPERRRGRRRGRRTGLADPGLVLAVAGVAVIVVTLVALWIGWTALMLAVALLQVVVARAWIDWLEVPAAALCSLAVLGVAVVTDVGVVVARTTVDPVFERADGLDQLAPGLGAVFLLAVLAQLLRRDEPDATGPRSGALAGIVAVCTGGAIVVGLSLWLPLLASRSGEAPVLGGAVVCGAVAVAVGVRAWVRPVDLPPPAVVVPVLLAAASGPFYVISRITAG